MNIHDIIVNKTNYFGHEYSWIYFHKQLYIPVTTTVIRQIILIMNIQELIL
jgi:hypothetical protein